MFDPLSGSNSASRQKNSGSRALWGLSARGRGGAGRGRGGAGRVEREGAGRGARAAGGGGGADGWAPAGACGERRPGRRRRASRRPRCHGRGSRSRAPCRRRRSRRDRASRAARSRRRRPARSRAPRRAPSRAHRVPSCTRFPCPGGAVSPAGPAGPTATGATGSSGGSGVGPAPPPEHERGPRAIRSPAATTAHRRARLPQRNRSTRRGCPPLRPLIPR
jgi:hypothetical protein